MGSGASTNSTCTTMERKIPFEQPDINVHLNHFTTTQHILITFVTTLLAVGVALLLIIVAMLCFDAAHKMSQSRPRRQAPSTPMSDGCNSNQCCGGTLRRLFGFAAQGEQQRHGREEGVELGGAT